MVKTFHNLKNWEIILASKSPRRQQLLTELGLPFTVKVIDTDESYPKHLSSGEIAEYIAIQKTKPFEDQLKNNQLLITSDTIVWANQQALGKPNNRQEAIDMLLSLSGKAHEVFSGVCLKSSSKQKAFVSGTKVYFKQLCLDEIEYYVDNYQPFDKAGAYGIQEWIGYVGVEKIEGSYFNVMGLPIQKLYTELLNF